MSKPNWGVVSTVSEPAPLLAAFAAHYVSAGASHIHLFLDSPNPKAEALLARFPQVQITQADQHYYRTRWKVAKPADIHFRQRLNANDCYKIGAVEWLLHADADEFVETDNLADELAEQPENIDSLRLANSERVFLLGEKAESVFAGLARLPMTAREARAIRLIGPDAYQYTTNGLSGHALGKSISRTGRGQRLGIHGPIRTGKPLVRPAKATICHFDGLTPFHFVLKLVRYADTTIYNSNRPVGKNRVMQVNFARECGFDLARLRELHGMVSGIAAERTGRLFATKLLRKIGKSPLAAARQFYKEDELDLTIQGFDRALAARSAEATQLHARWVELGLEQ